MTATANERRAIAVETINWLRSEMVVNGAYEYKGKAIYDGLTRDHIDYVIGVMGESTPTATTERTGP